NALALTINYFPYWWHLAIASAISGASNAVYMVGQNAYILDCANVQEKGTYAGVHNLFIGISTFFGSLIMGIIADQLIAIYDKWTILFILHWVVAGVRFLAGFGYLFLDDPKIVQKTTNNITGN
ncbi:MAG: MFS transporter, partial [Candidatus Thorarchaeota archaeon]